MPCKCGTGSKEHVCNDCVCVKKRKPCEPSCHCRTVPGIKCNNPYSKHVSSAARVAVNTSTVSTLQQAQPQPQYVVVHHQPVVQQQQLPVGGWSTGSQVVPAPAEGPQQRLQEEMRHDYDNLVMLFTTTRESLAYDPQKAQLYPMLFAMFFTAAERVVAAGRQSLAGYPLLECSGGTPELQHILGTMLHKAQLKTILLENPTLMQWRVNPQVDEAALRDFFTQLHARVAPQ